MKPGIIIAAAGRSTRFTLAGGTAHKLSAELAEGSVFEQSLHHALGSGLAVHVVTRPDNLHVQAVCHTRHIPFSLLASPGLGDSIAAGVRATCGWHGWLIHLADMPFVPAEAFIQVANALARHSLVRPRVNQRSGHPVGFSALWRDRLCRLSGDRGAREILGAAPVHFIELQDALLLQDIDLPSHLPPAGGKAHAAS